MRNNHPLHSIKEGLPMVSAGYSHSEGLITSIIEIEGHR